VTYEPELVPRWTSAMRQAYVFVRQSHALELSGAEALRQFRAGGGHIRTQDWYTLRRGAEDAATSAEIIKRLPGDMSPPLDWLPEVDFAFQRKYVMRVKANVMDAGGIVLTDVWRTIESDVNLSIDEWMDEYDDYIVDDPTIPNPTQWDVTDFYFELRST